MNITLREFYVAVAIAIGIVLVVAPTIYVTDTQLENVIAEFYLDMEKIKNRLEDLEGEGEDGHQSNSEVQQSPIRP